MGGVYVPGIMPLPGFLQVTCDLDGEPSTVAMLRESLSIIHKFAEENPSFAAVRIYTGLATVVPEGVTAWIQAVEEFLMDCELHYAPSQLALILKYDDRYKHPHSFFHEQGAY